MIDYDNRCPLCGEDRADNIRILSDEHLQCLICGVIYMAEHQLTEHEVLERYMDKQWD